MKGLSTFLSEHISFISMPVECPDLEIAFYVTTFIHMKHNLNLFNFLLRQVLPVYNKHTYIPAELVK